MVWDGETTSQLPRAIRTLLLLAQEVAPLEMGELVTLATLAQFVAAAADAVAVGHIQAKVAGTAAVVDTLNVFGAARAALEVIVGLVVAVAVMVALGLPVAAAVVAGPTITVAVVASGF